MKQAIKALALVCVLALGCAVFCACGGKSESAKTEETQPAAAALTNENGVVLMENPAIHAGDSAAQEKLEQYLQAHNALSAAAANLSSDYYTAKVFAKGNAVVLEMDVTADLTDAQKQSLSGTAEAIKQNADYSLAKGRTDSGVSDMVVVIAFVGRDNTVLASALSDTAQETAATTAPQETTQPATEADNQENQDNAENAENAENSENAGNGEETAE